MPRITFSSQEVRLAVGSSSLEFPEGYRSKIDEHWARINDSGRFFNGPVLAASSLRSDGSDLAVELMLTDYAHYLYAAQDTGHEFDCHAVFSAAVILTSDNYILLGQMAAHTSAPGQIQCPGGGIELGVGRELDARACCQREVTEELGRDFSRDPGCFLPLCLKSGGDLATVGIFYALLLDVTAEQAQKSFSSYQAAQRAAGELPEFDRLHAVKFDVGSIAEFVQLNEGCIVDYLAPLLRAGWHEASVALLALKTEMSSPDTAAELGTHRPR